MNGLSKYYIRKIINCFSSEMTATETSRKLKINRNTVNKYYRIIRGAISNYQEIQRKIQHVPHDEQHYYFSWHKNKGLIHTVQDDTLAFKLSTNVDRVYIEVVRLEDIPEDQISMDNDSADENQNGANNGLGLDFGFSPTHLYYRNGKQPDTATRFFMYAKEKLTKFYGVKEEYTYLYLKELEFRFNNQDKDLGKLIWKILPHHSAEWLKTSKHRR